MRFIAAFSDGGMNRYLPSALATGMEQIQVNFVDACGWFRPAMLSDGDIKSKDRELPLRNRSTS
jgi:hypothetical protein